MGRGGIDGSEAARIYLGITRLVVLTSTWRGSRSVQVKL